MVKLTPNIYVSVCACAHACCHEADLGIHNLLFTVQILICPPLPSSIFFTVFFLIKSSPGNPMVILEKVAWISLMSALCFLTTNQ